jgi:hypothetical protein
MKKIFGIIFLLIGISLIGIGVETLTKSSTRDKSFEGRFRNEISENYRSDNNERQIAGISLIGGGFLFFIIGIVMLVTKTKIQRKKEVELEVLKKLELSLNSIQLGQTNNSMTQKLPVENFEKIERLGKLKEQGLLTEEEFQQQKKIILG